MQARGVIVQRLHTIGSVDLCLILPFRNGQEKYAAHNGICRLYIQPQDNGCVLLCLCNIFLRRGQRQTGEGPPAFVQMPCLAVNEAFTLTFPKACVIASQGKLVLFTQELRLCESR